jgi:AcrR family transcriptional regulator
MDAQRQQGRPTSSPRPSREGRWQEILATAAEVFQEKGYQSATLNDIASRLGILRGSLYHYIDNKEDLLFELLRETHLRGLNAVRAFEFVDDDHANQLELFIRSWMGGPGLRTPMDVSEYDFRFLSKDRRLEIVQLRRDIHRTVQKLITDGVRAGAFRPEVDPYLLTSTLFRLFGSTSQWYPGDQIKDIDRLIDWYVLLVFDGVRAD